MDKRVQQLEKQQSETKDYSAEIAQISMKLEHLATVNDLAERQASNNSQIATLGADIKEQQTKHGKIISEIPKRTKFQIEHRFTASISVLDLKFYRSVFLMIFPSFIRMFCCSFFSPISTSKIVAFLIAKSYCS